MTARRPVAAALPAVALLAVALGGCTSSGGDARPPAAQALPSGAAAPSATGSPPLTPAQELTQQLLGGAQDPQPLATVSGSLPADNGIAAAAVEVDVLEVRARADSTLLRWRLRSASGEGLRVRSSALSRPSRFDTRAVVLVDAKGGQRLQPFTYAPQLRDGDDLMCVCSILPARVGSAGELMYALYPPLAAGTTTVDVAVPGLETAQDVAVTR